MKLYVSDLKFGRSAHIQGVIYWEHMGHCYPERGWVDNVNVVLGWWMGALTKLAMGDAAGSFKFMEGPYELALHRIKAQEVDVSVAGEKFREICSLSFFVNEVLRAEHWLHETSFGTPNVNKCLSYQGFLRAEALLLEALSRKT